MHLGASRSEDHEDKSMGAGLFRHREALQAINERPRITDVGLQYIKELRNLETLHLGVSQITDAGAAHLSELRELKMLTLGHTESDQCGHSTFGIAGTVGIPRSSGYAIER